MEVKISLKARKERLSDSKVQLGVLGGNGQIHHKPQFAKKLEDIGVSSLKPAETEVLQINVGKMCNQTCKHCHVDAGPDRKEIMTRDTMKEILEVSKSLNIKTVDLTGGAPEMNPDFRWFLEKLTAQGKKIILRCNLTIILANPAYRDLPEFYKKHKVNVVSSLPHFSALRTDAQRGSGVFDKSIEALKMLNSVGYGKSDPNLKLDLVYNPSGAFLPGSQQSLEDDFKHKLKSKFDIEFNQLFAITNLPVSRFLDYLLKSGNYEAYMEKLIDAFNPSTIDNLMCRNTLSVGWDGYLYDCDFNQMLDLKVDVDKNKVHIRDYDSQVLQNRSIVVNQHCFGCTAGAGSSCGGEIV